MYLFKNDETLCICTYMYMYIYNIFQSIPAYQNQPGRRVVTVNLGDFCLLPPFSIRHRPRMVAGGY